MVGVELPGADEGDRQGDIEGAQWRLWMASMEGSGAVGAAGGYVVDPERAQECIAELSRIAADVRRSVISSHQFYFDPPGYDAVSTNAARQGAVMGERALTYVRAWAAQIEVTRDALQRQVDAYRAVEQSNSRLT